MKDMCIFASLSLYMCIFASLAARRIREREGKKCVCVFPSITALRVSRQHVRHSSHGALASHGHVCT